MSLASSAKRWLAIGVVAALYFGAARLALLLAFDKTNASPVWPASGIAFAAVLMLGVRVWPGILVGAFLANLAVLMSNHVALGPAALVSSLGIAIGNTLEPLTGTWLLRRMVGTRGPFTGGHDVFRFVLAALAMCMVSSLIGPTTLCLAGITPWTLYGTMWFTWWLGDVSGVLILAPMLVAWREHPGFRWQPRRSLEAGLLFVSLVVVSRGVFFGHSSSGGLVRQAYLLIPFLLWAAYRFGVRESTSAVVLVSGFAIWGTVNGSGPFAGDSLNDSLLSLQVFVCVNAVTILVLSAALRERGQALQELEAVNASLEQRVEERTRELAGANARLERNEAMLAEAQRVAHLGSWEWNIASNQLRWSDELYRIFGVEPREFTSTYEAFLSCVHPDDRQAVQDIVGRAFEDHQPFQFDERIVRPDGSVRHVLSRGEVFVDEKGTTVRMFGVCEDITEQKEAQQELARRAEELARSNLELEQFAYVASHDLKEPLRSVSSFAQLLARRYQGKLDADADVYIRFLVDGVQRMSQLIDDLLAYGRLSRNPMGLAPSDCEAILHKVLATHRATIEQTGAVVTYDPLPTMVADESQLRQLFQNLIGNALKFHGEAPPRVHVSAERNQEAWVFTVRDQGIGIAPEFAERIFVIFQRLHGRAQYPGTGVGLAICKKVVDQHGGRIWVQSEPGAGATFHFTLPLAA